VGKATLVEPDIEAGAKLVKALDLHHFPLSAAFWIYSSDVDDWTMMIASPILDEHGPQWAYRRLRDASGKKPPIRLSRISLIADHDPLVALLRRAVSVQNGGIRLTNISINGVVIEDAYLYRTVPPDKPTSERVPKPKAALG
jgi:hypothetical protein